MIRYLRWYSLSNCSITPTSFSFPKSHAQSRCRYPALNPANTTSAVTSRGTFRVRVRVRARVRVRVRVRIRVRVRVV